MPSVEILARVQFAFTIAFHYIYPPLSIGLGVCLVIMEGLYLKTGLAIYQEITRFWIRIFALIFGIGVATGIVMEFEFGTNWATYSHYVGDIFGSALAAEGIFAFALESGFLGVLLFGWNRVGKGVHYFATIMVALGSIFSALWIVIANSWQQTPAGFRIEGTGMQARAVVTDFWEMVLNPSSVDRFSHVIIGAFLAGSFLVMSVAAWYILRKQFTAHAQAMFKVGLRVAAVAALLQLFTGHRSAEYVSEYQPAKLAAMEGHYDSLAAADMYMIGWVNQQKQQTSGIKIPGGLSFLTHGSFSAPVEGLRATPEADRPTAVNFVFQTYHTMVIIGFTLIGLTLLAAFLLWKKKLFEQRWLMIIFVGAVLLPQIANQVGWYTAEVGRQPWVVYKLLRTSDALSKTVSANQVMFSLVLFTMVYALLFVLFLFLLHRKIQHGPDVTQNEEEVSDLYSKRNLA
ncbi:cytochrome ubiquinol oxidase subunit I [Chitinophaga agrisoli]|uniref:Cytochrome ubiquinol oxidase subunit I n=1 Tax=Chitinophaga agrisoli TaxID=2607653 RepID=A0A5B2W1N2_9BACT|nr:cytochrome ubiquinol oxidase subunit I [Chitinophaga agrisoli]KAA2244582.1 cytochrome ubiquinol oxidase subunit I [Chitinophaga agrisoli]